MRISEPTIEDIDLQNEVPSLHLERRKIFHEIHQTTQNNQDNSLRRKIDPSPTSDRIPEKSSR